VRLQSYHEGTAQLKTRLFETYKREYENFAQLDGESIDAMFSRFQTIVNKMRANKQQLSYDDHEKALKLLYALDRKVWDVKVCPLSLNPLTTTPSLWMSFLASSSPPRSITKPKPKSKTHMYLPWLWSQVIIVQVLWLTLHMFLLLCPLWCLLQRSR
jgi:hypothetical protein